MFSQHGRETGGAGWRAEIWDEAGTTRGGGVGGVDGESQRWRRKKQEGKRKRKKYTPGCRYKCAAAAISAIAGRDSLWSVKRNLFDSGRSNNNRWIGEEGLGCFFLEVNQSRPLLRYPPAAHAAAPGTSLSFVYGCVLHPYICQARIHGLLSRQPSSALRALHGRGNFSRQTHVESVEDFAASFGVPAPHPTHTRSHPSRYPCLRRSSIPSACTFIPGDLKHFSFPMFSLIIKSSLPGSFFCRWSKTKGKRSQLASAHFSF